MKDSREGITILEAVDKICLACCCSGYDCDGTKCDFCPVRKLADDYCRSN
jgi:hypothetical protein